MAVHAASTRGCRVTTTTISREQREYAEARVTAAGLDDLITIVGADYRDLRGSYDKLVSLEMIEAVGWEWFDVYFRHCSRLLKPDGLFFLQAIVVADRAFEIEKRTRSFANQVIFPGGCLPSVESIQSSIASQTDFRTVALEDISASYVLTLRAWRERFEAAAERLEELGYDERFRRTWSFYLSMSEAGFAETRIRDVQMLFAKPHWSGSPEHRGRATRRQGSPGGRRRVVATATRATESGSLKAMTKLATAIALILALALPAAASAAEPTPPVQPATGPGGVAHKWDSMKTVFHDDPTTTSTTGPTSRGSGPASSARSPIACR